ncbi:MAG: transposase [Ginsengibacter sp.]
MQLNYMDKDPLQPGCYYHIYNRGNNKENIFKQPRNYNHFLMLWKKHIQPVALTFCYSLQPNHFHFLVFTKENKAATEISKAFGNCFNAYAKSINKAYNRTGSLFQERFGRKLISDHKYFLEIIYYIHSNIQKHGLHNDFTTYPYSSYLSFISDKPTLLQRDEVLDWFGGRHEFINFHESNKELMIQYLKELSDLNL